MSRGTRTRLLAGEDGVALVIAIILLAVLVIVTTTVLSFTSANSRDAASKRSGLTAYGLAEAGVNNALAQLAPHYGSDRDSQGNPIHDVTPFDSSWAQGSEQDPTLGSTTPCVDPAAPTCPLQWSTTLLPGPGVAPIRGIIKITSIGRTPNPTGPTASALTKTLVAYVEVRQPPANLPTPWWWNDVYAGGTNPNNQCDVSVSSGVNFRSPVVIAGNLCLQAQGAVSAPGTLTVGGWVSLSAQGSIGSWSQPLTSLVIQGSCDNSLKMNPACKLTQQSNVYTNNPSNPSKSSIDSSAFTNTVPDLSITPPDFQQMYDDSGVWNGTDPAWSETCTATAPTTNNSLDGPVTAPNPINGDAAPFDLAPSTYDYTCTTQTGKLTWTRTGGTAGNLTISGSVYIDGSLYTDPNAQVTYKGVGVIATTGDVNFGNNTYVCATSPNTGLSDCNSGWTQDPVTGAPLLGIISNGTFNGTNLRGFQGAIFATNVLNVSGGQTNVDGPLVTLGTLAPGQQVGSTFSFSVVPSGFGTGVLPPYLLGPTTYGNG